MPANLSIEEQLAVMPVAAGIAIEDEETGALWISSGIGNEGRSDFVWFGPYTLEFITQLAAEEENA